MRIRCLTSPYLCHSLTFLLTDNLYLGHLVTVVVVVVVSQPVTHVGHEGGAVTTTVGVIGHSFFVHGATTVEVDMMRHNGWGGQVFNGGQCSEGPSASSQIMSTATLHTCFCEWPRLSIRVTRWTSGGRWMRRWSWSDLSVSLLNWSR